MRSPANNVASLLARSADACPRLPAVALGTRVLHDYAALAQRAARLAGAFAEAGLAPGERVALVARNVPEYVETLFACWWAGLCAVPVNAKLHPRELAFILDDSGARWAFTDPAWHGALAGTNLGRCVEFGGAEYVALLDSQPVSTPYACEPDAPAWLFYTSGTTGRPKGVVISHGNLAAMTQAFLSSVEAIAPGDAILHPAPLSHGSGLYVVPHVARAAVNVVPESGGFDPAEIAALLATWKNTLFFAAPTMVKWLVRSPAFDGAGLGRLKCIVYGGGPMYVADCKEAHVRLGPRLAQIYGQGESPMTISAMGRALLAAALARGDDARVGSVGVAQAGVEIRIGGRDDAPLPPGEAGEVLVRGPTVMQGYWRNPDATAAALASGWLHTGDIGRLDADGFLTLMDRSKDLIISGGSNIYPREVEEVLLAHPGVAEAAVVGRPHPDWGEEVVACIVARAGFASSALERDLDAWCLERIARFKRPRAYVFLPELPKNNTGKVLKTVLRERLKPAEARVGVVSDTCGVGHDSNPDE